MLPTQSTTLTSKVNVAFAFENRNRYVSAIVLKEASQDAASGSCTYDCDFESHDLWFEKFVGIRCR